MAMLRMRAVGIFLDVGGTLAHGRDRGGVHGVEEIVGFKDHSRLGVGVDPGSELGIDFVHGRGRRDVLVDEFGGNGGALLGVGGEAGGGGGESTGGASETRGAGGAGSRGSEAQAPKGTEGGGSHFWGRSLTRKLEVGRRADER